MNRPTKLLAGLLVCALGAGVVRAQTPAQDIIVTRQAGFSLQQAAFNAIRAAIEGKQDLKPYEKAAAAIAFWSGQIPSVFPPGSETGHDTKAKPAVWSDRTGFEKDAQDASAAADKLAPLLKAGDSDAALAQLKVLDNACVACHRAYRNR
jgi:cytochrome c556